MSKPKETIITEYHASAVALAQITSTKFGSTIPAGKCRYVIGIILSAAAAQRFAIYLGETGSASSTTLLMVNLPADTVEVIGSMDPEKPVLVCRPQTAAGGSTKTQNILGIGHETSAIDCTMVYYDA